MKYWYVLRNRKGEWIDIRKLTPARVKEDNEKFAAAGLTARWGSKSKVRPL